MKKRKKTNQDKHISEERFGSIVATVVVLYERVLADDVEPEVVAKMLLADETGREFLSDVPTKTLVKAAFVGRKRYERKKFFLAATEHVVAAIEEIATNKHKLAKKIFWEDLAEREFEYNGELLPRWLVKKAFHIVLKRQKEERLAYRKWHNSAWDYAVKLVEKRFRGNAYIDLSFADTLIKYQGRPISAKMLKAACLTVINQRKSARKKEIYCKA